MFGFLKPDKEKKLQKEYEKLMQKAMEAQRSGDIESFAKLSSQADELMKEKDNIVKS